MKDQLFPIVTCVLLLCNLVFIGSALINAPVALVTALQWILVIANVLMLIIGSSVILRKHPKHFSQKQVTTFQVVFFVLFALSFALLIVLLAVQPIFFMVFMPFEFFILAFYIGWYFFLARHILPIIA